MCVVDQNALESTGNIENYIVSEANADNNYEHRTFTHATIYTNQCLLSTATVLILNNQNSWVKCNALLDSASQSNLMSQSLSEKLNLTYEKVNMPLSGVGQIETNIIGKTKTCIKSRFNDFQARLQFLIIPKVTEKLPLIGFDKSQIKYPKNLNLADEKFNIPKEIDLLIEAEIFFDLLKEGRMKLGTVGPVLQETYFGWIITGNLNFNINATVDKFQKRVCNITNVSNKQLHDSLSNFLLIEELEKERILSKNEQYCEDYFKQTTKRDELGIFTVKYPFNPEFKEQLGDSKATAIKRFKSLETRFTKNADLKEQYVNFMREYESLGHMTFQSTLDSDNSIENKSYFLPHTAVLRDQSLTTKCRVVFDASAKTSTNVSFNDIILPGPTIQDDLFSILLRLRLRKIVLSADVKMMYRCIKIDPDERSYQKIIWRENPNEKMKIYELNTVTYGTSSAPFQATRCLKEVAI
ncbi:uncharacterized protein LOC126734640 [Anthonomus grandis grandis]|uniref:uncharacterized protein LOC126734640 n=1 Tax=Anthonomus grandis grandis TaxID=2921223 RepID=UPI0021658ADD|nr:uncharacterized protein LOC126734640 [Anthonomus grandis grandis]